MKKITCVLALLLLIAFSTEPSLPPQHFAIGVEMNELTLPPQH
ncbi:hypothetical protein [Tumebacillus algifaecis]|nr:hypothetical protein [Tumebacillus algifaecis]